MNSQTFEENSILQWSDKVQKEVRIANDQNTTPEDFLINKPTLNFKVFIGMTYMTQFRRLTGVQSYAEAFLRS